MGQYSTGFTSLRYTGTSGPQTHDLLITSDTTEPPQPPTHIGKQVLQQSVSIHMGTTCAPLLADLYLYEAEFVQKLIR
jgi:hypothetical protein